jgi:thiol-disulfide isomerase/thioredoxin
MKFGGRQLILLLVIAGVLGIWLYRKYRVAPDIAFAQLPLQNLDGSVFDKNELDGKSVFVHYWATWCGECLQEMPSIEAAYTARSNDMVFLMISDQTPDQINAYLAKHDYPMRFVRINKRFQELGINTIPTTILYNRNGTEVYSHVGGVSWEEPAMADILKGVAEQ